MEALLVLAFLIGIGVFVVRGAITVRKSDGGDSSETGSAIPLGLITVLELGMLSTERVSPFIPAAIAIGILVILMGRSNSIYRIGSWGLSALGMVASVPLALSMATGRTSCAGPSLTTGAWNMVILAFFALSMAAGWYGAKTIRPAFGVALFGSLSVVDYLASPLGYSLFTDNRSLALPVAMIGACVLGGLSGVSPQIATWLASGITILVLVAETAGATCGPISEGIGMVMIAYAVTIFLLSLIPRFGRR